MENPLKMDDLGGTTIFDRGYNNPSYKDYNNPGDFQGIGDEILPQLIWG